MQIEEYRHYAEEDIFGIIQDNMIKHPFPLYMDNILDFIYDCHKKNRRLYFMSAKLEKAIKEWLEVKDNTHWYESESVVRDLTDRQKRNYEFSRINESRAKEQVEAEVYRLIGNSAVNGSNQASQLNELLKNLKR